MDKIIPNTGEEKLDQAIKQWLKYDKNPKTSEAVQQLVADGNVEELRVSFGLRMEFGTAGLRAAMGAGTSRMNDLTIIQTTQGFCSYLEKSFPDLKERGVVIGFDARAHPPSGSSSIRFAKLAAAVFISHGVPVYLFSDITPTPFVNIQLFQPTATTRALTREGRRRTHAVLQNVCRQPPASLHAADSPYSHPELQRRRTTHPWAAYRQTRTDHRGHWCAVSRDHPGQPSPPSPGPHPGSSCPQSAKK